MRHNYIFCQYTQLSEKGVVWIEVLLWLKLEKSIGELVEETDTDFPPPSTSNQARSTTYPQVSIRELWVNGVENNAEV